MSWVQTIVVTGMPDEPFVLHREPEGAEHVVEPEDVLTITFAADKPHGFEVSWVSDGLLLCRLGDSNVDIVDTRGRELRW